MTHIKGVELVNRIDELLKILKDPGASGQLLPRGNPEEGGGAIPEVLLKYMSHDKSNPRTLL